MTAPGISLAEWKSLRSFTDEAVRELMEKYFKSEGSFGDEADMPGISHEAQLWLDDFEMYPANNSSMTYLSEHSGRSNAYKALAPPAMTDFQFEQYAAEPPPVTKQSLSELDIQNIITNIKLRHDVSFDQDLSFQPEMNYMTNRKLRHNIRIDRELSFRPDIDGRTPQQKQHTNISPMNPAISKGEHPLYGHPADQLFQSLKRIPKASVVEVFEIPGVLHASGRKYTNNALGDYCAKFNFMKASHAAKLGLSVDQSDTKDVAIGSGKKVKTLGTVQATYQFATEPNLHQLLFHVLPSCVHDVILGKPFLKATRTLSSVTNFARRIKKRALEGLSRHRLFFLGDSAPTFTGLINGRPGDALADSGSSVLVMDQDYAQTLGLQILTGKAYHTRLVFADGSTAYTSGVTRGVRWQFGLGGDDEDHYLDFHILKNAPARVILSDSFLFDTEAYSRYECYLLDDEDKEELDEDAYFFTISHDPSYGAHGKLTFLYILLLISKHEYALCKAYPEEPLYIISCTRFLDCLASTSQIATRAPTDFINRLHRHVNNCKSGVRGTMSPQSR